MHDFGVPGPVTISFSANGPSYKVLPGSNCATVGVNIGQPCTVHIEFDPAVVGGHDNVLTLTPSVGPTSTVGLDGIANGVTALIETPLEFGAIAFGGNLTLPLTIHNTGVAGSPTVTFSVNGPSYQVIPGSQCATTGVMAGQSCTVQIEFDPVNVGVHNDILTVTPTGGAAPSTVKLDGIAN